MTKIKMCGMTREGDVVAAVELGVDAVGFVLWDKSPRAVTPGVAAQLVRRLPPFVTPVAVMVEPTRDDIMRAVDGVGCRVVQVHGRADEAALGRGSWQMVRAVSLGETGDAIVPEVADADITVLLDAHDPARHGGTGQSIDWTRAALVARRRRVILAGGLKPSTVGEAVRMVRPYAVDVASGVEREPGIKDRDAMRAFVDAVGAADDTDCR